ncbi:hypothetical protein EZS27_016484 [termite gut metagenome]|uniref:VOC domain-containing protein n=1 Tax=termite gut metagenome TaxID=433724 RepID=A0A5J4RNN7_9ZZZZ
MEYLSLMPNIGVENVNETVKFYAETLGFKQIMSAPDTGELVWAMVGSENVFIAFQETQNLQKEYPSLKDKPQNATLTFYIKMKGMKELYERLKDTNYLAKELHKTFYGTDEFAIYDNNGFVLTITED